MENRSPVSVRPNFLIVRKGICIHLIQQVISQKKYQAKAQAI